MKDQKDFRPLQLEYTFQASATSVYDAWITKPVAELWLFKNETNQLYFDADLKEGGRFSVVEYDGEKKIDHWGHARRGNCDWVSDETEWHRWWKALMAPDEDTSFAEKVLPGYSGIEITALAPILIAGT